MVFKHQLTPLTKHGQVTVHKGKGARPFPPQPKPGALTQAAPGLNNYAKATPMPMPQAQTPLPGTNPAAPDDSSPGQAQGMV